MKAKHFFIALVSTINFLSFAQNVQSDALATSGGLQAGTTTSGSGGNTFYGFETGKNITNGGGNTFIGHKTGNKTTTGYGNTFIGHATGENNISGFSNTFIGLQAGSGAQNNNSQSNVYIGNYAGGENTGNNNVFIGTQVGAEIPSSSNSILIGNNIQYYDTQNNTLVIDNLYYNEIGQDINPLIWGDFALDQLKFNAKVGVGYGFGNYPTTAGSINISNYNLFVKGGILTEELRVSLQTTWADYVFNKDYKLPSLTEVENYIKENGHLINVPSAKEVKENGIELGEMAKIQQEKIEELTLYIIELNKKLEAQEARLKTLENNQ